MDFLTAIFSKVFSVFMAFLMLLGFKMPSKDIDVPEQTLKTNYDFIFVNGFWGWGEYDKGNDTLPYWGFMTGDMMESMRNAGYKAHAASVDPVASAWDRACELYAQLTGTKVDYGEAHSEKYGHDRYGKDFTGAPLIEKWDSVNKINIINHSFGASTCALFASVLKNGSAEERAKTTDGTISPFFEGGKADWIYSIVSLAGTFKGTSLVTGNQAVGESFEALKNEITALVPDATVKQSGLIEGFLSSVSGLLQFATSGKVADPDTALFDMHPDNAKTMFKDIDVLDNVYYFTVPHCATKASSDGTYQTGDLAVADFAFYPFSNILGRTNTVTEGGIVLDESWQKNDGIVNTISENAPFDTPYNEIGVAPSKELAQTGFSKGVYNVFETYKGSHMALMGNVLRPNNSALPYLVELMDMINSL